MIYYPKKYELYANSMRCLYHKLILQKGPKPNLLISLRKIYEFECKYSATLLPTNLYEFCNELLTAASFRRKFIFQLKVHGNYLLNQKIFTAILLNICQNADFVEIEISNKTAIIKTNCKKTKQIKRLVFLMGGVILNVVNNDFLHIFLTLKKTKKETVDSQDAYELSVNPLSIINCYLI